ncbi:Dna2/Cas4 domain-containing protein [Desulfobacter vibrioformis]|uniref:Dna2/Cas4 domain-containing protein n=1 Tax=Desulfobacter vibrioformis TaxID=34031 RepID=UPI00054E626F|nr:Dna2/Cas4 domain-containing protein [Desulfobacter vibrioformis]
MLKNWPHATEFYEEVDRLNLHGLHFQHIALCERRAWMYLHHINFAQWYGKVQTGSAKHAASYSRDRTTQSLFGLAPDRIDWENRVVYENKGTAGAVDASNDQTAFYAVMLSLTTNLEWRAVTHILSTRRRREVPLDARQLKRLRTSLERLKLLTSMEKPPEARRIRLCAACSLAGFCGFD